MYTTPSATAGEAAVQRPDRNLQLARPVAVWTAERTPGLLAM
jgi:hypothetical protein